MRKVSRAYFTAVRGWQVGQENDDLFINRSRTIGVPQR
jgi:hypothetical protein